MTGIEACPRAARRSPTTRPTDSSHRIRTVVFEKGRVTDVAAEWPTGVTDPLTESRQSGAEGSGRGYRPVGLPVRRSQPSTAARKA
jgi:hypothetical protein